MPRDIEPALFADLIRQLGQKDVLEQMPIGTHILGLLGEQLRRDRGYCGL